MQHKAPPEGSRTLCELQCRLGEALRFQWLWEHR